MSRTRPSFSWCLTFLGALAAVPLSGQNVHAQSSTQINTTSDGTVVLGGMGDALAISSDGRYAVFAMSAPGLVPSDNNGVGDVYVKDLQTNAIARVSVASDGTERSAHSGLAGADISDNGQIVVFASQAALVADDTNACGDPAATCHDIYVHDRGTGQTTRISRGIGGTQANQHSEWPRISGDGRYVSFNSLASNLVPGDTNGASDVFLFDRQTGTTTRVSVTSAGVQGGVGQASYGAEVSDDGSIVTFLSDAQLMNPVEANCPSVFCTRAYMHNRSTGATTRISLPAGTRPRTAESRVAAVRLSANGRWIAVGVNEQNHTWLYLYDRVADKTTLFRERIGIVDALAISGDGRIVSAHIESSAFQGGPEGLRYDRIHGFAGPTFSWPPLVLSFDGELGLYAYRGGSLTDSVFLLDYDYDNDKMGDAWEVAFGLNSDVPDGGLDPDGDGVTNLAEHEAGTHPNGVVKRYLAEGAVNAFFTTQIALFNPGAQPQIVVLHFLGTSGLVSSQGVNLRPYERQTVVLTPTANIPENDFSTIIESIATVVVDRTMTWDATTYGAHAETAVESPATTWYLAEGATHGYFSLFYLLQNPNDAPADVTINYLRLAPETPVIKTYRVPPKSRMTLPVDDQGPELAATDVAARIDSNVPIIAERAMYATVPGHPILAAGHGGAGVTSTALKWFLAEGATGSFFDLYVLVANPNDADSELKVTYLFPDGEPLVKMYTAGKKNRLTISVENEDPRLADTPVSIVVESTNNQPVVVERAMWWPSGGWYEAHLSAGTTTTGTKWALAEGEVNVAQAKDTYILIANTGTTAGEATVTFYREAPVTPFTPPSPITIKVPLPANSRTNVQPVTVPGMTDIPGTRFATIVESNGVPIVVERAMYQTTNGLAWSAGTSAVATKLQ
jgi:Tol biopolymer transport system component